MEDRVREVLDQVQHDLDAGKSLTEALGGVATRCALYEALSREQHRALSAVYESYCLLLQFVEVIPDDTLDYLAEQLVGKPINRDYLKMVHDDVRGVLDEGASEL